MTKLPIKKLSTRERAQLRQDALTQTIEFVDDLVTEYGGKTLDLQPGTLEHEVAIQLHEIFQKAAEELGTWHLYSSLCLFHYDKGVDDTRGEASTDEEERISAHDES